jgi:hypothetical protein
MSSKLVISHMSVSLLSWIKQSINSSRLLGSQFAALSGFGDLSVWSRLPTTFLVHFRVICNCQLSDYVKPNEELLDIFDLYEDIDLISYMYDYENLLRANIPLDRKSICTGKPNTYGHSRLPTTFPVHFRVICNCLCTSENIGEN